MHRQVLLLAMAQALFQTASILVMTVGALVGSQIAPAQALSTAPVAAMLFGTVVMIVPASTWMARVGRRRGFVSGAILGALGGLVAALGIHWRSLAVLALGMALIGSYQAFAQFYRYAASEVSTPAFRPRAVSLVLAGGVVAAFLGPALGTLGTGLIETAYAGSFLILAATCAVAAALLMRLDVGQLAVEATEGTRRPLRAIVGQPGYAVALFCAATGSGVMVLAMTATPLAMAHHDHALGEVATVIQAHVLGMFVPAFFSGALIARFGVNRIMFTGIVLMSAHVAVSLSGTGLFSFTAALVLLGVGWNFLFVGGTTLLTSTYLPAERGNAQATNDLVVYVVGLTSSLGGGALLEAVGWRLMNLFLLPWLLLALVAVCWLGRGRRAVVATRADGL